MKFFKIWLSVFAIGLLASCASRYKNLNPEKISATAKSLTENGAMLEYKYETLPRNYKRRAKKQDIKIVSIKITNQGTKDIIFGNDINLFYANNKPVAIIDRNLLHRSIKQRTAYYLFYLALTPFNIAKNEANAKSTFPIGFIAGPGLAGGNMILSANANKKFKKNLAKYDPTGAVIKPGASIYGLIGIRSETEETLQLKQSKP